MFDTTVFGKKILDKRKLQGLTQEQLGGELGVSAQSISKWENGETLPDIALLPSICKVLGISADTLLGTDDDTDIEPLIKNISKRIFSSTSPDNAFLRALALLHCGATGTVWQPDSEGTDVLLSFNKERLTSLDYWDSRGTALFVREAVLSEEVHSYDRIEAIHALTSSINWKIALYLLGGPAKEDALAEAGITDDTQCLREHLEEMLDAGLLTRERNGYMLDKQWGFVWTAVLKALTYGVEPGTQCFRWGE